MRCPYCSYSESKVIDSRSTDKGDSIRRRRECIKCYRRFTTYERYEDNALVVIKKDNTRETYKRNKILNGMLKACEKRRVERELLEKAINEIEIELYKQNRKEVNSSLIGELVMEKLKSIDDVAYIRFASVYREFKDSNSFVEVCEKLEK